VLNIPQTNGSLTAPSSISTVQKGTELLLWSSDEHSLGWPFPWVELRWTAAQAHAGSSSRAPGARLKKKKEYVVPSTENCSHRKTSHKKYSHFWRSLC
jgi:hypothetical protein